MALRNNLLPRSIKHLLFYVVTYFAFILLIENTFDILFGFGKQIQVYNLRFIFIARNAFLTETFLEVNIKTLYTFVKTLTTKRTLARGESLPEEAATSCLAFPLGERNLAPHHHLLPDSSFLLILPGQEEHLPLPGHHLGRDPQQDQYGQVLQ